MEDIDMELLPEPLPDLLSELKAGSSLPDGKEVGGPTDKGGGRGGGGP
jgi:hypothetical protein